MNHTLEPQQIGAPLVHSIQLTDNRVTITLSGTISRTEYLTANHELMRHDGFVPRGHSLWDYAEDASLDCLAVDVRQLALEDREASFDTPGRKVAVVARNPLIYGMSRMYMGYFEGGAWEIRTFQDRAEAEEWLERST